MTQKPYQRYKESGIEWIGKVPEHWEMKRLKHVASLNMGQSPSSEDCNQEGDGLPFLQGTADFGKVYPLPKHYCPVPNKLAHKNDILFSVRAPVGEINDADQIYGIGRGLCAVTPNTGNSNRYIFYCLQIIKEELLSVATGSTYEAVSIEQIRNSRCLLPLFEEQLSIASFLDRETSHIDTLISEKERLISLLQEYRQALISHVVTKGLDPNVKMKDSGVEWLGEIPNEWEMVRIASCFREINQTGGNDLPILSLSIHDGISDRELDENELDRKVTRSNDRTIYKRVSEGDLVYNMMRAWQGAFGMAKVAGIVSPAYIVARPIKIIRADYIERLLRTEQAIEEMRGRSHGVTDFRLRLYWDEFKNLKVCIPPLEEQGTITAFLDREIDRIDSLIDKAHRAIELLQEYRFSLITAAVTGKIDVREVVPSGSEKREIAHG